MFFPDFLMFPGKVHVIYSFDLSFYPSIAGKKTAFSFIQSKFVPKRVFYELCGGKSNLSQSVYFMNFAGEIESQSYINNMHLTK